MFIFMQLYLWCLTEVWVWSHCVVGSILDTGWGWSMESSWERWEWVGVMILTSCRPWGYCYECTQYHMIIVLLCTIIFCKRLTVANKPMVLISNLSHLLQSGKDHASTRYRWLCVWCFAAMVFSPILTTVNICNVPLMIFYDGVRYVRTCWNGILNCLLWSPYKQATLYTTARLMGPKVSSMCLDLCSQATLYNTARLMGLKVSSMCLDLC